MVDDEFAEKARQDYGPLWHAHDNRHTRTEQRNYLERRIAEAGWLVKQIKHPDDTKSIVRHVESNELDEQAAASTKKKPPLNMVNKLTGLFHTPTSSHPHHSARRRRKMTKEEEEEEEILAAAAALQEMEEQAKLDSYLRRKVAKTRVLERVVEWLGMKKQPAHHRHTQSKVEIPLEIQEKNLRCYTIHPPERIVEELRSIDEVFAEEAELRKFRPPGRYHGYLGAEKIYPLHSHPHTIDALLPNDHRGPLPEDLLMPDEDRRRRQRERAEKKEVERRRRVVRIKKAKLDFTRAQVELDEPPADTSTTSVASSGGPAAPRRINKQFRWRARHVADDNSVAHYAHPSVVFRREPAAATHSSSSQLGPGPESLGARSSAQDESTTRSQVRYGLGDCASVQSGPATDLYSMASLSQPSAGSGHPMGWVQHLESRDDLSARAYRSHLLAENSTCSQAHVTIKMQRHRRILHLDVHRLKLRPHLMSLRRKQGLTQQRALTA